MVSGYILLVNLKADKKIGEERQIRAAKGEIKIITQVLLEQPGGGCHPINSMENPPLACQIWRGIGHSHVDRGKHC